jgi:hypothetical protein
LIWQEWHKHSLGVKWVLYKNAVKQDSGMSRTSTALSTAVVTPQEKQAHVSEKKGIARNGGSSKQLAEAEPTARHNCMLCHFFVIFLI